MHMSCARLIYRLLEEFFAPGSELTHRLAVAYTVGVLSPTSEGPPVMIEGSDIAAQVGTVTGWATATEDAKASDTLLGKYGVPHSLTNPTVWGQLPGFTRSLSLGVDQHKQPVLYEGLIASSRVVDGFVRVSEAAGAGFILGFYRMGKDYHMSDMHLFWGCARHHVAEVIRHWHSAS